MGRHITRKEDPDHYESFEAAAAPPESEGRGIRATCVINYVQSIEMVINPGDGSKVTMEVQAMQEELQHIPLVNGKFSVEAIFVTPNVCETLRAGRLVIDHRHVLELGPLQRDAPVQCAILLDEKPTSFRLEVEVVDTPAVHPSEVLLMRHCLAILENDEFLGSVSSSHLQNQVRELPFYKDVIGPIRKNWTEFIRAHIDKWDIFKYSQEEIVEAAIATTCRAKEYRLVARTLLEDYREGDCARERIRVSAERQLHQMLCEKLRERPYEQSELLQVLVKEKSFLTLITPNLNKILDMFEQKPERYFVLRDRLHPILIELRRQGVVDDPKFDLWDNTEKPLYSFEHPDVEG